MLGPTRGVMVSTPAFLACHQCWSAASSLGLGLDFLALVFSETRRQRFSTGTPVSSPPSSVYGFIQ